MLGRFSILIVAWAMSMGLVVSGSPAAFPAAPTGIAATSRITGTITGPSGSAISDVSVVAHTWVPSTGDWKAVAWAFTDAAGKYDVMNLPAGTYRLYFIDAYGDFLPEYFDDVDTVEAATDIPVADGAVVSGLDAQLARPSQITGKVTNKAGEGLPDIAVSAYTDHLGDWGIAASATTNASGEYELTGLTRGTYRLGFIDYSDKYADEFFDNATSVESATDISVPESATKAGQDVQLDVGARISGTITDPSGSAISDVSVTAHRWSPSMGMWVEVASGSTDSAGEYVVNGLPAGAYALYFAYGPGDFMPEYFDNVAQIESAHTIVVAAGDTATGKDAQLARPSNITGQVTDEAGIGLSGITVRAYTDNSGYWSVVAEGTTNVFGDYYLAGLAHGTYQLEFSDPAGNFVTEFFDNATTLERATPINVGESANVRSDAQLAPGGHISGTITEAGGSPIQGVYVEAWVKPAGWETWTRTGKTVETNAAGDYDLAGLPPGTYRLGFDSPYGTHVDEFYDNAVAIEEAADIVVGEGATVTDKDAQLAWPSSIRGRVTGADGLGLPNVVVSAFHKVPGSSSWAPVDAFAFTDGGGEYILGGLRAGTYRVQFDPFYNEGYVAEFYDNALSLDEAVDITVGEEETVPGTNAELAPGGDQSPTFENVVLPSIDGVPHVGELLSARPGSWTPSGAEYSYEWLADDLVVASGTATFIPDASMIGQRISVRVTATGIDARPGQATSDQTAAVVAATPPPTTPPPTTPTPTPTPTPTATQTVAPMVDPASALAQIVAALKVTGSVRVGKTLKLVNLASDARTSIEYKIRWFARSKQIKGATKPKLKLTSALRGQVITVKVKATAGAVSKTRSIKVGKVGKVK